MAKSYGLDDVREILDIKDTLDGICYSNQMSKNGAGTLLQRMGKYPEVWSNNDIEVARQSSLPFGLEAEVDKLKEKRRRLGL